MATIVLSAVGTAVGSGLGGSVLGLSSAVLGRAAGATVGRMIDQRLLGGSAAVEQGRVERFRVSSASEGVPLADVYGRTRVAGQVIWASQFLEHSQSTSTGGKGGGGGASTTQFSYSVSLALALCAGGITRVSRIWADGREIAKKDFNIRVYNGDSDQLPDPKIEAVEGVGNAPAYRGIAYVVIEDLALAAFGNRVPQLSFEVLRPARPEGEDAPKDIADAIQGVALVPGTGEYALATTPVHFDAGLGVVKTANVNSPSGKSDFETSIEALTEEMPACKSTSLVVSWFGDDLRAFACDIKPKVEQNTQDGSLPWTVNGVARASAEVIDQIDARPVYGGTPADAAVVEAIQHMRSAGQHVMFYPFILMDQLPGNGLPDPWSGDLGQPEFPWRGRITTSLAPGQSGSPDQSAAAASEVDQFFGTCTVGDFAVSGAAVTYIGPAEWSYRRFILHYAHLCAAAGGVDAFCIGSEMRSLTQIRGAGSSFPTVAKLVELAADVRAILGATCKISYAADWSEYFGYHPADGSGDVYFHLDDLWADANIDFIGVDNYLSLSDWREGDDHADAVWGSIYNQLYLQGNILGGKDYDWYYGSKEEEAAQIRAPISDGAYGEDWVFRAKDFPGWWQGQHFDRIGGVKQSTPTAWVPQSKPFWFTELGCAAVDKATNEPNKFLDPKSSESAAPKYSNGRRDDLIQAEYLRAMTDFWGDAGNNPVSSVYGGSMIDMSKAHVWAWDTRPFPRFPNDRTLWSDGDNYGRGHWISGRIGAQSLAGVVADICEAAGVVDYDVSALYGTVRGYALAQGGSARAALQPLMLAYGFDATERDGALQFRSRTGILDQTLDVENLAANREQSADIEFSRAPEAEIAGRIQLNFLEAEGDFAPRAAEVVFPDDDATGVDRSELPLVLTQSEARGIIERWLAEARVARDGLRLSVPPSRGDLGAGDVIALPEAGGAAHYRIDRSETAGLTQLEAVRIERSIYVPGVEPDEPVLVAPNTPALPIWGQFLDLPLLRGDEVAHAPHLAVSATPWPGSAALFSSASADGFVLNRLIETSATVGTTLNTLDFASPDVIDRGPALQVEMNGGNMASVPMPDVLNGANLAAIGDGTSGNWEVFQFANADLVGEQTWEITGRLRGQSGTDGMIPETWPPGSRIVILDAAVGQIDLAAGARGLERTYRIGPGDRPFDDPAYTETTHAFAGIGLRPYAPVHLRAEAKANGDIAVGWIRRTRIDGDSWQSVEVPLGETSESYVVQIEQGGVLIREAIVGEPVWVYTAADLATDSITAPFDILVAQQSDAWGPGLFKRIIFNG